MSELRHTRAELRAANDRGRDGVVDQTRMPYAPSPVGRPSIVHEVAGATQTDRVPILHAFVANTGTIVDALA